MENALFEASYRRLFGSTISVTARSDEFFEFFYQAFLADADIRDLFRDTDMKRQAAMLRKSFFHLAGFYVTHQPSGELERLARLHHRLGVDDEHYDLWLDSLVATVSVFDAACDLATEMAWRWALTPGITYMKLYAHFARPG